MRTSFFGAVLIACSVSSACGGDDESGEAVGRGTAACRDFQDASCDFASDRCGAIARGTCDATFRGIQCASDERASACANALNQAACGTQAPECALDIVVDRAAATAACQTLTQAFCDHNAMCGGAPASECTATAAAMGVDCSQALSIDLRYEMCLEALDMLSCGSPTPSVCNQVVLVLPPGASMS